MERWRDLHICGGEEELLLSWILKSYFVKYIEDLKK